MVSGRVNRCENNEVEEKFGIMRLTRPFQCICLHVGGFVFLRVLQSTAYLTMNSSA